MIRGLAAAAAVIVLTTAVPASADPFDYGSASTFTLSGTCAGQPTTVIHGPGATTVGFVAGRATVARRMDFYARDAVTVMFVHEDASYPALAAAHELLECDLVLSLTGNRVAAWVQVPRG